LLLSETGGVAGRELQFDSIGENPRRADWILRDDAAIPFHFHLQIFRWEDRFPQVEDIGEALRLEPMIEVESDMGLKDTGFALAENATAIDEFLSDMADLGEMEMSWNRFAAGKKEAGKDVGVGTEKSFESREFHDGIYIPVKECRQGQLAPAPAFGDSDSFQMEPAKSHPPTPPVGRVCLHLCRTDSARDPSLLERYRALLDEEERGRLARYRFEADAEAFLISHALLRVCLSQFGSVPPEAWRFQRNEHGRPEICGMGLSPLHFSLSHTRGLVACAVGRGVEVGVDVENSVRGGDVLAIADRFFAEEEKAALRRLPDEERRSRFLSLWTLKEAYAKARGLGLSLPFHQLGFEIDGNTIASDFSEELADNPLLWSFTLLRPTDEHWLAIAAQTSPALSPPLEASWILPLTNKRTTLAGKVVAASRPLRS